MKVPITICIDVEPDDRLVDPSVPKDWTGFEGTYDFFRKLRPRLEDATRSRLVKRFVFETPDKLIKRVG